MQANRFQNPKLPTYHLLGIKSFFISVYFLVDKSKVNSCQTEGIAFCSLCYLEPTDKNNLFKYYSRIYLIIAELVLVGQTKVLSLFSKVFQNVLS